GEEATRLSELALAQEPNDPEYAFALGTALARNPTEANLQRAVSLLRQAVALNRRSPEYHQQLGAALQQLDRWEAARREYLATLSLDPDRSAAYNGLTQVAHGLQRPQQVALWARAMRAVQARLRDEQSQRREAGDHPLDPTPLLLLAQTLLRSGRLAPAQGQLEQALQ